MQQNNASLIKRQQKKQRIQVYEVEKFKIQIISWMNMMKMQKMPAQSLEMIKLQQLAKEVLKMVNFQMYTMEQLSTLISVLEGSKKRPINMIDMRNYVIDWLLINPEGCEACFLRLQDPVVKALANNIIQCWKQKTSTSPGTTAQPPAYKPTPANYPYNFMSNNNMYTQQPSMDNYYQQMQHQYYMYLQMCQNYPQNNNPYPYYPMYQNKKNEQPAQQPISQPQPPKQSQMPSQAVKAQVKVGQQMKSKISQAHINVEMKKQQPKQTRGRKSNAAKNKVTIEDYNMCYERYAGGHGKKYLEEGPFRIIPPPKEQSKNYDRRSSEEVQERRTIEPSQFSNCVCGGQAAFLDRFVCEECKHSFHHSCMKRSNPAKTKMCGFCFMRKMDALQTVLMPIRENYIHRISDRGFEQLYDFQPAIQEIESRMSSSGSRTLNQYDIQLRCMRLDDAINGVCEYSWPDESCLRILKQKMLEFPALQHNSSLKKRKDTSIFILNQLKDARNRNIKSVQIRLQVKHLPLNQVNTKKIKNNFTFLFGVYLVQRKTVEQLCTEILNQQKRVYFIRDYFQEQMKDEEQEIQVEQIKVSLLDPFSWNLMQTPVRGNNCNHSQCFDMQTYIRFIQVQKFRTWKCPTCTKSCQEFYVDQQQMQILDTYRTKCARGEELSTDVTFNRSGEVSFQNTSNDACSDSQESVKFKRVEKLGSKGGKNKSRCEEVVVENREMNPQGRQLLINDSSQINMEFEKVSLEGVQSPPDMVPE